MNISSNDRELLIKNYYGYKMVDIKSKAIFELVNKAIDDMTDEEKEQHPEYEVVGGYLKILDESECGQLWWDSLSERYKNIIKAMPNFDKEIFEDVTGIKI